VLEVDFPHSDSNWPRPPADRGYQRCHTVTMIVFAISRLVQLPMRRLDTTPTTASRMRTDRPAI
jgi:hypothetical protein